ncbi:MAG: nucleotidyltransferase family protein [Alphaproteobacteria bacterium]|nr:nucleotidyltransferase family protein [Alphaproteobacteria bacterium]
MSNTPPEKAFILGAGFGTRLRPYTNDRPKPMVEINGRSLITRIMDKLTEAGVKDAYVNTHYLADVLADHLKSYEKQHDISIHLSHEPDILDTGGGIKNILSEFRDKPFYVIAGDSLWTDGDVPALTRLAQNWDSTKMDILTLMQPLKEMVLTKGIGDYSFKDERHVKRSLDKSGTHMWTNIRINDPSLFEKYEPEIQKNQKFSILPLLDACEKAGRLCALEHDADWHHISTPDDLEAVNTAFEKDDL